MSKALNTEMEWAAFKSKLAVGSIVKGEIFAHMPFGVFVALQSFFLGLIEIPNFKEKGEPMTPREYPELGEPIRAVVMGFREGNHQVALSARPSDIAQSEKRRGGTQPAIRRRRSAAMRRRRSAVRNEAPRRAARVG